MTLDELIQRVPEPFRPVAFEYGPALLKMTADELWAWIEMLVKGDATAAYRAVLDKMDSDDKLAEWDRVNAQWAQEDTDNAARKSLQQQAVLATLRVLLVAALALVGL